MCAVDQAAGALRGQNGALNWAERQPHSITDRERVITEKETQGTFWEERHDFIGALGQVTAMWGVREDVRAKKRAVLAPHWGKLREQE